MKDTDTKKEGKDPCQEEEGYKLLGIEGKRVFYSTSSMLIWTEKNIAEGDKIRENEWEKTTTNLWI